MSKIIYNPMDVGKEVINSRGKVRKIRKYHMTPEEMIIARTKWKEEVSTVDKRLRKKAGTKFFNPYRKGIYYYQLQTLFLLSANEWHSLTDIVSRLEEYTSNMPLKKSGMKRYGCYTVWDKFRGKSSRDNARTCKDYIGRIQENFVFLQRLSMLHPYGYKLHQVCAAIDVRRINKKGFEQGAYFYRLSTYDTMAKAKPIKDFSRFTFPSNEGKYVSYKFIGTIITKDKKIVEGVEA